MPLIGPDPERARIRIHRFATPPAAPSKRWRGVDRLRPGQDMRVSGFARRDEAASRRARSVQEGRVSIAILEGGRAFVRCVCRNSYE